MPWLPSLGAWAPAPCTTTLSPPPPPQPPNPPSPLLSPRTRTCPGPLHPQGLRNQCTWPAPCMLLAWGWGRCCCQVGALALLPRSVASNRNSGMEKQALLQRDAATDRARRELFGEPGFVPFGAGVAEIFKKKWARVWGSNPTPSPPPLPTPAHPCCGQCSAPGWHLAAARSHLGAPVALLTCRLLHSWAWLWPGLSAPHPPHMHVHTERTCIRPPCLPATHGQVQGRAWADGGASGAHSHGAGWGQGPGLECMGTTHANPAILVLILMEHTG